MAWKHVDDEMPKERDWEHGADGEVVWMHPQHYVIGVRYWMTLKEMRPKCEELDRQMGR